MRDFGPALNPLGIFLLVQDLETALSGTLRFVNLRASPGRVRLFKFFSYRYHDLDSTSIVDGPKPPQCCIDIVSPD